MKKQKNEGITIIGLAVTIIVMLLLAGATISSLVGQKGILPIWLKHKIRQD